MPLVSPAKVEIVQFETVEEQALYKKLINELRCLVCQNQNLADSNAELAIDLRRKVKGLITEGSTYDDVVDYMVSRYGDFVMYRPPFNQSTIFLWLSPAVLLVLTFSVVIFRRRSAMDQNVSSNFDQSQHAKVRELLKDTKDQN
ncbi:MAG: cytochrome c-type biogenesis protein CcmH [Acidiferrobacterales bacterium]|nr:cytochrome c-type biogenesis protein CcmH [Acidiferrobacterales bacterium]